MSRKYIGMQSFRSPFIGVPFQGLGAAWPPGRMYGDVSNFRAPYDDGYYTDMGRTPDGLGDVPTDSSILPEAFRRFVETGAEMPAWKRDIASALNQVPFWAYGLIAVASLGSAYYGYKEWEKHKKKPKHA